MVKNIGIGITGSFCTHSEIIALIKELKKKKYNIIPILTDNANSVSTRFGSCDKFVENLIEITGNNVITSIVDAEPIGPNNIIDLLLVAPCTGNTLSKLANAITDNAVTMVAKALSRNNKPVVIGISTNDALGLNFRNLATLYNTKNYFFVPFFQDDAKVKPNSLKANWDYVAQTIESAEKGQQIQPILSNKK